MSIFFFLLGTIIGSFLNVLILRYGTGLSPFKGNSKCFSCGVRLKWPELVPIISFLSLRGRCRHCRAKISWQYPIVEFFTGVLFLLTFYKINPIENQSWTIFFVHLIIMSFLMFIVVYDFKHKIIPDFFSYGFAILAIVSFFLISGFQIFSLSIFTIFAGPILAFPFAFLWIISRGRWIGFGDAKLALGIGWFLGLVSGISAVMFGVWIGAVYGVLAIFIGRLLNKKNITRKSEIPFGPFLIIGTLLVYFFGFSIFSLVLFTL